MKKTKHIFFMPASVTFSQYAIMLKKGIVQAPEQMGKRRSSDFVFKASKLANRHQG
jgi:hypothetical protein